MFAGTFIELSSAGELLAAAADRAGMAPATVRAPADQGHPNRWRILAVLAVLAAVAVMAQLDLHLPAQSPGKLKALASTELIGERGGDWPPRSLSFCPRFPYTRFHFGTVLMCTRRT